MPRVVLCVLVFIGLTGCQSGLQKKHADTSYSEQSAEKDFFKSSRGSQRFPVGEKKNFSAWLGTLASRRAHPTSESNPVQVSSFYRLKKGKTLPLKFSEFKRKERQVLHYLNVVQARYGSLDRNYVRVCFTVGIFYHYNKYYNKAIKYYSRSFNAYNKVANTNKQYYTGYYHNLGLIYYKKNNLQKALKYFKLAESNNRMYGRAGSVQAAYAYIKLGLVHRDLGNYQRSIDLLQKSIQVIKQSHRVSAAMLSMNYNELGKSYSKAQYYKNAIDSHLRALKIDVYHYPEHPKVSYTCEKLGEAFEKNKQYHEAAKYYRNALFISKRYIGKSHKTTLRLSRRLYRVQKKLKKAKS